MEVVSPRFLGHFEPEALVVVSTMNFRKSAPEYLPDAEGKNSPEMLRIGLYVSGRQGWGGEIHYKKLKYTPLLYLPAAMRSNIFVETHLCKLSVCDTPIARITGCVSSLRI